MSIEPGQPTASTDSGMIAEGDQIQLAMYSIETAGARIKEQWYLDTSVSGGGTNLDIGRVWADWTGRGVTIGVVDGGFDIAQKDLAGRFDLAASYDPRDAATGMSVAPDNALVDTHGTWVSGVVGANGRNDWGIVGVAFDAELVGSYIRMGAQTSSRAEVASLLARQASFDISNNSWNYKTAFGDNFRDPAWAAIKNAVVADAAQGRDGLGTVMVFAAGNDRQYVAGDANLDGDNTNYHSLTNARQIITVGASTPQGSVASFSTPGASILVSAPGTSILTTTPGNANAPEGDFVYVSGTSFAAPIVSGVSALMLEANPLLGYRDVQQILALSATKPGPTGSSWSMNGATNWNGSGNLFNADLGFGIVDAHAAVRLAETWIGQRTAANEAVVATSGAITDAPALRDGGSNTFTTAVADPTGRLSVEWVEVDLDLSHDFIGDLVVTLRSPSGTESVLVDRPAAGTSARDDLRVTLTSANFLGEDADGAWSLIVSDQGGGGTGKLISYALRLYGDASGEATYVFTDQFGALGSSAAVVGERGARGVLNLASVTTDVAIDLSGASASVVAGRGLQIAQGTIVTEIFGGDGNDRLVAGKDAVALHGGRGDDVLTGGSGPGIVYQLYGDQGDDLFLAGAGVDDVHGGAGQDTVRYATDAAVVIDLASGIGSGGAAGDRFGDVENVIGSTGDDRIVGDAHDNRIAGGRGSNELQGGAGHDTALFDFAFRDAKITLDGASVIVDAAGSHDVLWGFEAFAFNDAILDLSQLAPPPPAPASQPVVDAPAPRGDVVPAPQGETIVAPQAEPSTAPHAENMLHFGTVTHDASSNAAKVYALYEGLLGRAPDPLGLEYWTARLASGLPASQLSAEFLSSSEGQAGIATLDNAGFVKGLYEFTLDRAPDANGLRFWTSELDRGVTRGEVGVGFALSSEHLASLDDTLDAGIFVPDAAVSQAARVYYTILDRAPDAAGLAYWADQLRGGTSLEVATDAFLTSPEVQAKTAGLSTAQFVDWVYDNALGRHAEADGLAYWTGAIDQGAATRTDVSAAISQSAEAQSHLSPLIEAGWHLA